MALTPSNPLQPGWPAPDFTLSTADGRPVSLAGTRGARGTLVAFICNHCPFVKHIRPAFVRFADSCAAQDVAVIAINANNADAYPDDRPERMLEDAHTWGFGFPYLVDAQQTVAQAYRAACTPDLYLFDADLKLFYHGQFDASRPGNQVPVTGADLRAAVAALLAGQQPSATQTPSVGCNIKWKPGNEPDYFHH